MIAVWQINYRRAREEKGISVKKLLQDSKKEMMVLISKVRGVEAVRSG